MYIGMTRRPSKLFFDPALGITTSCLSDPNVLQLLTFLPFDPLVPTEVVPVVPVVAVVPVVRWTVVAEKLPMCNDFVH